MNSAAITICSLALLASFAGLAFVFAPAWLAFAAGGLLAGVLLTAAYRWFRRFRYRWLLLANVVGLLVITLVIVAIAIPNLMVARDRATDGFEARYTAEVSYDQQHDRWQILDRVVVHEGARALQRRMALLEEQLRSGQFDEGRSIDDSLDSIASEQWDGLAAAFDNKGWTTESKEASELTLSRQRTIDSEQSWFAFRDPNQITMLTGRDLPGECKLDEHVRVLFDLPENFVGATAPAEQSRTTRADGTERIAVAADLELLPRNEQGVPVVSAEIFHPWLRHSAATQLRAFAAIPLGNWLIAGFFGVFHEKLRRRILWPLYCWLQSPLRRNVEDAKALTSIEESPASKSLAGEAAWADAITFSIDTNSVSMSGEEQESKGDAA